MKSALQDLLSVSYGMISITSISHQRGGCISNARRAVVNVFAAKGGIKNGAEGTVPRQRSDTIYLPRARALNPPVRRSRSQAEPLAPRAKGPAAPSTLTPVRACQPSGIQFPAANATIIAPKCRKRQSSHEPCLFLHSERTCRASDYNSLPTIGASCFSRPMRSSKVSGVMDSAPSHHACSG